MKKLMKKAFTLVELLIVIAIIGILAVTVLLALNPAEAQKKTRDAQRVKDATTLQAAMEQLLDSGVAIPAVAAGDLGNASGAYSSIAGNLKQGIKSENCSAAANWLGVDVCAYIKTVPLDPSNGLDRSVSDGTAATTTAVTAPTLMFYRARIEGSNYEISVRQESTSNFQKISGDGGNNADWFEIFSGDSALL